MNENENFNKDNPISNSNDDLNQQPKDHLDNVNKIIKQKENAELIEEKKNNVEKSSRLHHHKNSTISSDVEIKTGTIKIISANFNQNSNDPFSENERNFMSDE